MMPLLLKRSANVYSGDICLLYIFIHCKRFYDLQLFLQRILGQYHCEKLWGILKKSFLFGKLVREED